LKVLVTGAGGLVGRAMADHCATEGEAVSAFDHKSLDITDQESVSTVIDHERPDVVINCAAWTDVDGCESDLERARRVNSLGPEFLATACRQSNALLISISTDYVFDGSKIGFYTQRDQPNPISAYGRSKLDGERLAQHAWARTVIVRSGYIFGVGGANFLSTIVARGLRGESMKAIRDMSGTPTYARDLARRLHRLAHLDLPGTYHVVNAGPGVSFQEFAEAAFEIAELDRSLLQSTTLAALNRPAPRPRNSRLRCLLSEAVGLEPLPDWHQALRDFVATHAGARASAVLSGSNAG
jgi:dTDP-4-dehydrorhamnose reductase